MVLAARASTDLAMHQGIPTGVHVLCEKSDRLLLMRRSGTGFFDGLYSLPGGHVEPGESVLQAAARELFEETGVVVELCDIEFIGVVHRYSDTNRIDFFVRAREWQGEAEIREPDKCDGLAWFGRASLPDALVPYVRAALDQPREPWVMERGWEGQVGAAAVE